MSLPAIDESAVRKQSTAPSFDRGREYYREGHVVSLEQRGTLLHAEVEGSEYDPYRVQVEFGAVGVTGANCTCPYAFEGWCKHIVAALLTAAHEPERIAQRKSVAALLEPLDAEGMRDALEHLTRAHPEVVDTLEHFLSLRDQGQPQAGGAQERKSKRQTKVDPEPFRREVESIIHRSVSTRRDSYFDHTPAELFGVLEKLHPFLEEGDGENALRILEAVTGAYVEASTEVYGGYYEGDDLFEPLDTLWAEAVLSAELSHAERDALLTDLLAWRGEVEEYGIDAFYMAEAALEQGWDHPPLVAALRGEFGDTGTRAGEAPPFDDELIQLRLRILERQERYQEYLNLAEAEGQGAHFVTMLVKLGRTEEALERVPGYIHLPDEALRVAKALREGGELQRALDVAEYGLGLEGRYRQQLAAWTSELAAALGEREKALSAGMIAFKEQPSLVDYQRLEGLAGDDWRNVKEELLASLRRHGSYLNVSAKVDIFLHEGRLEDAIASVDSESSYNAEPIHRVMDAVKGTHPDWVIENAQRRAASIMDKGKAKYYHHAVDWLKKAQAAYLKAGREAQWQRQLADIKEKHGRKYKLMGLLKDGLYRSSGAE